MVLKDLQVSRQHKWTSEHECQAPLHGVFAFNAPWKPVGNLSSKHSVVTNKDTTLM